MLDPLTTGAIGAGVSGIADIFSQLTKKNSTENILDDYRAKLRELLITDSEKSSMVNSLRRNTNTSVANANNQIGIAGTNKLNQGTFGAALLGPIVAEQNKSIYDLEQNIFNQNFGVKNKIADSYLQQPTGIDIGETLGTAISGFQTGLSVDNYLTADEKFINKMNAMNGMFGKSNLPSYLEMLQNFHL